MTPITRPLLLLPALLAAHVAIAHATPPVDEPHFHTPAPPAVDPEQPPPDLPPASAFTRAKQPRRGPHIALFADSGLAHYRYSVLFGSEGAFTGVQVNWGLDLTWSMSEVRHIHLGLRLRGFSTIAMTGSGQDGSLFDETTPRHDVRTQLWGANAAAVIESTYVWGSLGAGAFRQLAEEDSDGNVLEEPRTVPELQLCAGVRVPVGRHLAFTVGGEVGTMFLFWRFGVTGGVQLRF